MARGVLGAIHWKVKRSIEQSRLRPLPNRGIPDKAGLRFGCAETASNGTIYFSVRIRKCVSRICEYFGRIEVPSDAGDYFDALATPTGREIEQSRLYSRLQ